VNFNRSSFDLLYYSARF